MSSYLIDGIGDEVTILFTSAFVVIMLTIAWMSTRVTDPSYDQFMATREQQRQQRQQQTQVPSQTASPAPPDSETQPRGQEDENPRSSTTSSLNNVPPNQTEENTQNENSENGAELQEGHMFIRLKFMDESVKVIQVKPQDTINDIRQKNFPSSTADRYRLIYRGQVLRNGSQTLEQCNVCGDVSPVIHCFLSAETPRQNQASSASQQIQQAVDELNMGHFFMPLFGSVLGFLWYVCIFHTSLFSLPSVFGIIGLTCFYIVLLVNQFF